MSPEYNFVRSRFQWSAELVEKFRVLWSDSALSARQIALRLGMTRNAVLGKRKRLGLPERGAGTRPPATGDSLRPSKASHARRGDTLREANIRREKPWRGPLPLADAATDLPPDQSDCAVTILELTESSCRWPLGQPSALMSYCGAPQEPGLSYCPRHCALALRR